MIILHEIQLRVLSFFSAFLLLSLAGTTPAHATDAVCGPANGGTYGNSNYGSSVPPSWGPPAASLCASGWTPSPGGYGFTGVTAQWTSWGWNCFSTDGGRNASCGANRTGSPTNNGICGSANGTVAGSAPSGGALCAVGTASAVSGSGPWSWTCSGSGTNPRISRCKTIPAVDTDCWMMTAAGAALLNPAPNIRKTGTGDNEIFYGNTIVNDMFGEYPRWSYTDTILGFIALGPSARLEVYQGHNLTGAKLIDIAGPVAIRGGTLTGWKTYSSCTIYNSGDCSSWSPITFNSHAEIPPGTYPPSVRFNVGDIPSYTLAATSSIGGNGSFKLSCPSASIVNGSCGGSPASCTTGTLSGDDGATSCGTTRHWSCNGSGGGTNASCTYTNAACAVNGSCSATAGSCATGTAASDNGLTSCGTTRTWSCNGSGGGSNASCSHTNPVCSINGACSATPGACTSGAVSADNGATSCGTTRTWICNGSGGGSNASCSYINAACPVSPPACGAAAGVSVATSPSSGLCAPGTSSTVTDTGTSWTWTCSP